MVKEIIIDFETTGLDYANDKIIQYTFLNNETKEYISGYVNPQRPMNLEASKVTGITDIDLKEYRPFSSHVDKILDFIGQEDNVFFIAHNGDHFDKLFFIRELQSCGKSLHPSWKFIDTLKLSRYFRPDLKQHTMDSLRTEFNLSTKNNHSASKDVFDLSMIYNHFRKDHCVEELHDISFHYISFGKYRGNDYRKLPLDYLDFLIQKKVYLNQPDLCSFLYQEKLLS